MRRVEIEVPAADLARWHEVCERQDQRLVLEIWRDQLAWGARPGGRRVGVINGQQHGERYGYVLLAADKLQRLTELAVAARDAGRETIAITFEDRLPDGYVLCCDGERVHDTPFGTVRRFA